MKSDYYLTEINLNSGRILFGDSCEQRIERLKIGLLCVSKLEAVLCSLQINSVASMRNVLAKSVYEDALKFFCIANLNKSSNYEYAGDNLLLTLTCCSTEVDCKKNINYKVKQCYTLALQNLNSLLEFIMQNKCDDIRFVQTIIDKKNSIENKIKKI